MTSLSARLLKTGELLTIEQDEIALRISGLPEKAPDHPVTVIEVTCAAPPFVDHHLIRPKWPRYGVNTGGAKS